MDDGSWMELVPKMVMGRESPSWPLAAQKVGRNWGSKKMSMGRPKWDYNGVIFMILGYSG